MDYATDDLWRAVALIGAVVFRLTLDALKRSVALGAPIYI